MEDVITNNRKAGFWVRFAAIWMDFIIICLILKTSAIVLKQFGILDNFEYIVVLCAVAYLAFFIGGKGRTIGKIICGLKVRQITNGPLSYLKGLLREVVGKFVAGIFFFIGFFWAGFSQSKRGWHDYIAQTVVTQDTKAIKRGRLVLTIVLALNVLLISSIVTLAFVNYSNLREKNVLRPEAIDVGALTKSDHEPFVTYLRANGKSPIEYVVEKFKQHDVVMLGEQHEVREVCEFISNLIEPLYHQANVKYFAMEVLKYKNQQLVNKLVTGEEYDEKLVLKLFRDCVWPLWGFQEYMDILKAVWQVNQTLPPDKEKIKVVCLANDLDGTVLESRRHLFWKLPGCLYRMVMNDKTMAKILEREVLRKGEKALVQVGGYHAFTHYRLPAVKSGKLVAEVPPRFGYILHGKYGNRIFQIVLHRWGLSYDFFSGNVNIQQPLGGLLEEVFAENGNKPVGFDVISSPFASLRDSTQYEFAYQKYVVFSDVARGYVFLKPLKELNKITWAKGFINESNFEKAKSIALKRGWVKSEECNTPQQLDEKLEQFFEN